MLNPPVEPYMGPWVADPRWRVGARSILAGAEYAIRRFESFGLAGVSASRVVRARDIVASVQDGVTPLRVANQSTLTLVAEANRTLFESYLIARAVAPAHEMPSPDCVERLQLMLGGADTADGDTDSNARDAQFELYLLAFLRIGGARAWMGGPDLWMDYGAETVGVAAKRVSSKKQLGVRLKDGARQVHDTNQRGFLAVNADVYFGGMLTPDDLEERGGAAQRRFASLRGYHNKFRADPAIIGLIGFGTVLRWNTASEPPQLDSSVYAQCRGIMDDPVEKDFMETYFAEVRTGFAARLRNAL